MLISLGLEPAQTRGVDDEGFPLGIREPDYQACQRLGGGAGPAFDAMVFHSDTFDNHRGAVDGLNLRAVDTLGRVDLEGRGGRDFRAGEPPGLEDGLVGACSRRVGQPAWDLQLPDRRGVQRSFSPAELERPVSLTRLDREPRQGGINLLDRSRARDRFQMVRGRFSHSGFERGHQFQPRGPHGGTIREHRKLPARRFGHRLLALSSVVTVERAIEADPVVGAEDQLHDQSVARFQVHPARVGPSGGHPQRVCPGGKPLGPPAVSLSGRSHVERADDGTVVPLDDLADEGLMHRALQRGNQPVHIGDGEQFAGRVEAGDRRCELLAGLGHLALDGLEEDHIDHHVGLIEMSSQERRDVEPAGIERGVRREPRVLTIGKHDHRFEPLGVVEFFFRARHRLNERGSVIGAKLAELLDQAVKLFRVPCARCAEAVDGTFGHRNVFAVGSSGKFADETRTGLSEGEDAQSRASRDRAKGGDQGLLGFLELRGGGVDHAPGTIENESNRAVAFAEAFDHGGVGTHCQARLGRRGGGGADGDDLGYRVDGDGRLAFEDLTSQEPFRDERRHFSNGTVVRRVGLSLPHKRARERELGGLGGLIASTSRDRAI